MAALKVVLALGTASLILKASSARKGPIDIAERARDGIVTAFCHVAHYGWHRSFGNAFSGVHVRR